MVLIGETECPLEITRKIATIVEPLLENVQQQGHDVMVEHRSIPMPEDVREAFCDAVHLFVEWKSGGPKQSVSFRRLRRVSLTGVCDLVLSYRNEPLPLKVHDQLWNLIDDTHMNLKVELCHRSIIRDWCALPNQTDSGIPSGGWAAEKRDGLGRPRKAPFSIRAARCNE
jgi:hypothetical protein